MFARAHAPRSATPGDLPGGFTLIRYLDVVLVIASVPLVLLAGMPRLGFFVGAGGWIVTRFGVEVVRRRAWAANGVAARAALHLTAILGRVWLIALVVLAAKFGGSNADGITAAVVVLVAFTVELVISFVLRASLVPGSRRT
jgi:hypothetical protein